MRRFREKVSAKLVECRKNNVSIPGFLLSTFVNIIWERFFFQRFFKSGEAVGGEPLHMLFFHTLVNDPEKCFHAKADAPDFDSWNLTRKEFSAFLDELYRRGYILVKMRDLLGQKLSVPEGRTPVMFSFDDVNYRSIVKGFGFPERMAVDENGEFLYSFPPEEEKNPMPDADHIGILEQFIGKHPDFSLNGARAILGLTGSDGIFGYRCMDDPAVLKELIRTLEEKGYEFACHSFRHRHMEFSDKYPNGFSGIADTGEWLRVTGKTVGKTDYYITPFGVDIRHDPILLWYLRRKGFRYFLSVSRERTAKKQNGCYFASRVNIDGITMRKFREDYEKYYCDVSKVYDRKRKKPLSAPDLSSL